MGPAHTCSGCGDPLAPDAAFCPSCGARRAPTPPVVGDPMIGQTIIGQYVIRSKLGEGGMGAVYLADQPSVGRQAVIKVMHPAVSQDPTVSRRFEVEAKAASQLNHPHIVTIYNYGAMEDGTLFLAMEHCKGGSLEELVRGGAISANRAVAIGGQICDALAAAHRHGVVHRDLKPSNIMLTEVGRQRDFAKVLDFGIAKMEGVKMTRTGSVIGTPQYMSPEQLRGDPLDGRSDLYSLGVMLYELVAGQLPFKSESAAGYMHKHLNEAPVSPTKIRQNIPTALASIILKTLAKDPAERFQDADAMGLALEGATRGEAVTLPPTELEPRRRGGRVGLWIALGSSAVVALGATAALVVVLGSGDEPAQVARASTKAKVAWRSVKDPPAATEANVDAGEVSAAPVIKSSVGARDPAATSGARKKARKGPARRPPDKRVQLAMSKTTSRLEAKTPGKKGAVVPPGFLYKQPSARKVPAATAAYGKMTGDQLEALLKRVIRNAKVPPSTVDKTFQSYNSALARWPKANRETYRRQYLVPLLKAYRKPSLQFKANERKSLARLKQIFLNMPTKASLKPDQMKSILANALSSYDRGSFPATDRVFYKRVALLAMIKSMAANPTQALR